MQGNDTDIIVMTDKVKAFIGKLGLWVTKLEQKSLQPPAYAGSSLVDFPTLKMETIRSSERSVHIRTTRNHSPENGIFHSHLRENSRAYIEEKVLNILSRLKDFVQENSVEK
jgi:hypothetical protein